MNRGITRKRDTEHFIVFQTGICMNDSTLNIIDLLVIRQLFQHRQMTLRQIQSPPHQIQNPKGTLQNSHPHSFTLERPYRNRQIPTYSNYIQNIHTHAQSQASKAFMGRHVGRDEWINEHPIGNRYLSMSKATRSNRQAQQYLPSYPIPQ